MTFLDKSVTNLRMNTELIVVSERSFRMMCVKMLVNGVLGFVVSSIVSERHMNCRSCEPASLCAAVNQDKYM